MHKFFARFAEPSSLAGLAALATLAKLGGVPANAIQAITTGIGAAAGLLAILIPEGK